MLSLIALFAIAATFNLFLARVANRHLDPVALWFTAASVTALLARITDHHLIASSQIVTIVALIACQFLPWVIYSVLIYPHFVSPLRRLPTAPGGSWFMGHAAKIGCESSGDPQLEWARTVPNNGLIRYMHWFNIERVYLATPEAIGEVLVTKNYEFVKPARSRDRLAKLLGYGILLAEGDEHKRQRKILTPAFAFRHIKQLYPVFWSKSLELVDQVTKTIAANDPQDDSSNVIEIRSWASRATLDIIGIAGMGRDFGSLQDPNSPLTALYKKMFERPKYFRQLLFLSTFLPLWLINSLPIKRNTDLMEIKSRNRQVCRDLILAKRARLDNKEPTERDILSVAIESGGFTDEELIDQMMTFLIAGHETTSVSMTWALYLLSKNKDVQTRLRKEILSSLPGLESRDGRQISAADIDNCQYLRAVCNEVLRVRPPVAVTMRMADCDTSIQGHFIPRGTYIVVCPQSVNNDPALWGQDAADFNPDRWMTQTGQADNKGGASSNYSYLTFLHGPRGCIGMSFAKAEFACLLAAWVGSFETELRDPDEKLDIISQIVQRPKHGLFVKVKPVG